METEVARVVDRSRWTSCSPLSRISAKARSSYAFGRAALGLACCPCAIASAQSLDVGQFAHTAWRVQDGAPGAIRGLAQGADGVLWIASEQGLYQFDGVSFERYQPPPGQALLPNGTHILLPLPDTALWIGYFTAGVSVVHRGRIVTYGTQDGLPGGTVTAIARDSSGTMWASTTRGLARLVGRRWEELGPDAGYSGGFTEPVFVDHRGAVWAVGDGGIYVLPRGASRFQKREVTLAGGRDARVQFLAIAPDGSIWAVQKPFGLFPIADARGDPTPTGSLAYADTLPFGVTFARGQPAVVTSMSGRLIRLRLPAAMGAASQRTEAGAPTAAEISFSSAAGMSGDRVMAALYDREGNLWVGTPTGLDRFRETKLTPIAWPGRVSWPAVAADSNGAVWVAARNGAPSALFAIGERVIPRSGSPATLTSIYRDLSGGIWVGGEAGLWERKGDALAPVPLPVPPSALNPYARQIHAIARERDDRLWVSIVTDGVYRRHIEGRWERFGATAGLDRLVANVITTDSVGWTWLGYPSGQVALVVGDSVRVLAAADGLSVGSVLAISAYGDRVWVAGQLGVAALARNVERRGGKPFVMITTDGDPLRGISGVVETADGELWLNGADGVTRIAAAEVQRALREPGYPAHYERLDYRDGIEPPAPQLRPLPSAVSGTDGRIWFTSAGGVSWVDPRRVRTNTMPPLVHLRAFAAGGRRYLIGNSASDTVRLPPRTTPISVAYTAYSLAVPERVRFKYRLEGLDTTWQDAGGRREAFFTNLPPGEYKFRLLAANDDGVWSTAGVSLAFAILPAWDQTWWFFALVPATIAAAAAGAAVAWQRRRSHLAAERAQARFEAMLDERTRVARELHDTLLGDMAGVAMQLDAGARRAGLFGGANETVVELLSMLSKQVQHALVEARRSVTAMRTFPGALPPLHEQLSNASHRAFAETGIVAHVEHEGSPRACAPTVEAEIVGIAAEAMTNARQHAGCRTVAVSCRYSPREVRVVVRDDGRGFDPEQATQAGHWGLVGMRERAASIGATLSVARAATTGTEVVLVVPVGPDRPR